MAMLPEGAEQPVSISEIATRLNTNKRTITAWVAFLINHKGVPIGSRRSAPSGYYLITSDEERNNAIAPLTAQALEELKRAEKLRSIDLHTWRNNFNDNKKATTGVPLNTPSCFVPYSRRSFPTDTVNTLKKKRRFLYIMEQSTKTRKLADLLDEAEQRSAALAGLADVVSDLSEYEGSVIVTVNSNKETFELANNSLNNYRKISGVSLSLLILANDVLKLTSEANMSAE
ncbi:hypothetical protein SOP56_03835 [Weissella confusa]|uniref:hypothetical protein n=2 Tax=Lactobacillaceae TaxID=33958 RepID=UPI002A76644A|nr:hypothetical protein [Weissella confusa]MDY2528992.1 hypothetical protein [Weissella confusa]